VRLLWLAGSSDYVARRQHAACKEWFAGAGVYYYDGSVYAIAIRLTFFGSVFVKPLTE
jgi:hypothetical protein